jgi:hypothetical protein
VKNEVSDDGPLVKSGMYARVMLPTGKTQIATLVYKDALVLGGHQPIVHVVDAAPNAKQGKARPVSVQLGIAQGNMIQVTGDLQPGQLVVVQGNERLRPGQDVQFQRVVEPPAESQVKSPPVGAQSNSPLK